jgi:hypothetical protein
MEMAEDVCLLLVGITHGIAVWWVWGLKLLWNDSQACGGGHA